MARLKPPLNWHFGDYEILHSGETRPGQRWAHPVGGGGAGSVFRARYKGQMTRAVKFLDPARQLRTTQDAESFTHTFRREFDRLLGITHSNIVKLLDFGFADLEDSIYAFIVMEYIPGSQLLEICAHEGTDGSIFVDLMDDVLEALQYLHQQDPPILHADVKDSNVRCRETSVGFQAILLDLGAAHAVPGTGQPPEPSKDLFHREREETLFVSTPRIANKDHLDLIGEWIPYDTLRELWPYYDLHAFGIMLGEALANSEISSKVGEDLGHRALTALGLIQERLIRDPGDEYYSTVSQLRDDWSKLRKGYLAPLEIPELSLAAEFRNSIPTPGGRVIITSRLHPIVNHTLFQRLRDIPQLEFVSLIYPGAKHSRLQHSLTTYEMARLYIAHLLNDPAFVLMASRVDVEATLLLALLHDLGHYPLSHMFEDLAAEQRIQPSESHHQLIPTDDDLFMGVLDPTDIVGGGDRVYLAEIASAWVSECASAPEGADSRTLAQVIEESFPGALPSLVAIRRVVEGHSSENPAHLVLAGVLSSTIDVDKAAYLRDDSLATGISYGRGVDLDGLLGSLRAPELSDFRRHGVIAITDKGVSAAESMASARQWMFRRVYWHHTNRSIMAMIKHAANVLLAAGCLSISDYLGANLLGTAQGGLEYLTSAWNAARDASEFDSGEGPPRNPITGLQHGRRQLYKRLLSIPAVGDAQSVRIHQRLTRLGSLERTKLEAEIAKIISKQLGREPQGVGTILIDVPAKDRGPQSGADHADVLVYPRADPETAFPLEHFTPVFEQMTNEYMQLANKCRVFVAPDIASALADRDIDSTEALRDYLDPEQPQAG